MKTTVFSDVAPCSLVGTDRCFRGAYCLHHQGERLLQLYQLATKQTHCVIQNFITLRSGKSNSNVRETAKQLPRNLMDGHRFPSGACLHIQNAVLRTTHIFIQCNGEAFWQPVREDSYSLIYSQYMQKPIQFCDLCMLIETYTSHAYAVLKYWFLGVLHAPARAKNSLWPCPRPSVYLSHFSCRGRQPAWSESHCCATIETFGSHCWYTWFRNNHLESHSCNNDLRRNNVLWLRCATMTYVMWHEERLWNISVLQRFSPFRSY
jgi:hypothetical protein